MSKEYAEKLAALGPAVVELASALRTMVMEEAPNAIELRYETGSAVTAGYTFTGRPDDIFTHVAAYSRWVNLGFNQGASLADPACILRGEGAYIRHIRISSPRDLERPFVRRFVQQAAAAAKRPKAVDPRKAVLALQEGKRKPKR